MSESLQDPMILIFDLLTSKPYHLWDIPRSKFEDFEIRLLSYAVDRHTDIRKGSQNENHPSVERG